MLNHYLTNLLKPFSMGIGNDQIWSLRRERSSLWIGGCITLRWRKLLPVSYKHDLLKGQSLRQVSVSLKNYGIQSTSICSSRISENYHTLHSSSVSCPSCYMNWDNENTLFNKPKMNQSNISPLWRKKKNFATNKFLQPQFLCNFFFQYNIPTSEPSASINIAINTVICH